MTTRRVFLSMAAAAPFEAASLTEQSAGKILERSFPDPNLSYLLLNTANSRVACSRWPKLDEAVPVGSLVKPFLALAYGATHDFHFPGFDCLGVKSQCWLPQGHGPLRIRTAIAHSCNGYFLNLARDVQPDAVEDVTRKFTLNAPGRDSTPATLIGLGADWRDSPLAIARAYSELLARAVEPGSGELLAGLALCARSGTGRGIGAGAYAKTGTAPCVHRLRHRGDGYAIALFPTDAPRYALLVQKHGVPGVLAAVVCGKMRGALDGTMAE